MLDARYRKLLGDVVSERGRLTLIGAAIAVSLIALGAMLGAWAILTREIRVSYAGTAPAHATLEIPSGVDSELLGLVRRSGLVESADARKVLLSRVRVGADFRPLLLFVPPSFVELELNRFRSQSGAWPPPRGSILLERSATGMARATIGDSLELKTPHGAAQRVPVSGLVHDPGLAPAWQERSVYAYATRETLEALDGDARLDELRVRFAPEPADVRAAEQSAQRLGKWLEARGIQVAELRVPPPAAHPHQRQMMTILLLLITFAALSLLLSSVLVATSFSAMLARQVRELGVMKTLGASSRQLTSLYAVLVGLLGVAAAGVALPLGAWGAIATSRAIATMLNFELSSERLPLWVLSLQAASGVLLPLGLALVPIRAAARRSVRSTIDQHGVVSWQFAARLPNVLRNLLRRPKRLALTLLLLATGGALFVTALSVSAAWQKNLDKIRQTRHYDVEARLFQRSEAAERALASTPGVRLAEWWGYAPAAFARAGQIDSVHTYPDRGHGSLTLLGPPPSTQLVSFPVLSGRWLRDSDTDGVVLNHVAAASGIQVGSEVLLSAEHQLRRVHVVGVVEEIGSAGVVYMSRSAFESNFGPPRLARVTTLATSEAERERFIHRLERSLASAQAPVEQVMPFAELRTAVGDHVVILVRALVALAIALSLVGLLGLATAMSTAVLERTREIGVMKAVGASRRRILRLVLGEGIVTAMVSWLLAGLLSLPLTKLIESLIGRLGFLAPLPFVLSLGALVGWLGLVTSFSVLSTWLPARRAAAISVKQAMAEG